MDKNLTYSQLMEKRKELNFQGKYKEARAIEDQADEMLRSGKVSQEEFEAAVYL